MSSSNLKFTFPQFLKKTFLFLYSISNIATKVYLTPILTVALSSNFSDYTINWIKIGISLGIYELGKFLGNFLWYKMNNRFSNSFIATISLSIITIFNCLFGFIHHFWSLILIRFILGFCNNLPVISKSIYTELIQTEQENIKLSTITTISSVVSFLLPICTFRNDYYNSKIKNKKVNQFIISSSLLSLINMITLVFLFALIKKKYLRFKKKKQFIEMKNENNNNMDSMKRKNVFSIKKDNISLDVSPIEGSEDKNSARLNISSKEDDANNNNNNNIYEKIEKRDSNESIKNQQQMTIKKNKPQRIFSINNVSTNNIGNTNSENNNLNSTNAIEGSVSNKEIKFASIYALLQINDIILKLFTIIFLYIEFRNKIFWIALCLDLTNVIFIIINFPLSLYLVKTLSEKGKEISSYYITNMIYMALLITLCIGIIIPSYFYIEILNQKKILKIVIIIVLFVCIIIRNILNANIIQSYQIFIAVDFHLESKTMRKINSLQTHLADFFQGVFSVIASFAYFLLSNSDIMTFEKKIYTGLFFLLLPEGVILTILFLVKLFM